MKILLATFSLVTLALLAAPTGRAQSFTPGPNPIAGTVTAAQTLPSDAGVVSLTGNLQVSGSSVAAITVTGTSSIHNNGVIKQTGTRDGVDGQDNNGLVINNNGRFMIVGRWGGLLRAVEGYHGIIEGGRHGITAGEDDTNVSLSVFNQPLCTIRGDNGSGINIDGKDEHEVVTIDNHGWIIGNGRTGDGDGVDVDGIVDLTNGGLGTIQSLNSVDGPSEGISAGGGTILNYGTIKGDVAGGNTNGVGRGITLTGVKTTGGMREHIYADSTVTNSGLIKGQTDSAIVVLGPASGHTVTIDNQAGGRIEGGGNTVAAIQTAADNDTLYNAGDVSAESGRAINLGDGDDTLKITGGTIQGDISGGSGTNTCTIDPGARDFTYTHSISDFDSVEIKSGGVSFSGASTYSGTTTISGGTLIAANSTGSATGTGAVRVTAGTLGGNGSIDGDVKIGGGSGPARLAPGAPGQQDATLQIRRTLKFQTGGTYAYRFKATHRVIANGVTITGGATFVMLGNPPVLTTLTAISNTAATPIDGTFANLPDGSIITIQGHKLKASYKGGDGNDLTLAVLP